MNEPVAVEDGGVAETEDDDGIPDRIAPPDLDKAVAVVVVAVAVGTGERLMS